MNTLACPSTLDLKQEALVLIDARRYNGFLKQNESKTVMNTKAGIPEVTILLEETASETPDINKLVHVLSNFSFGRMALEKGIYNIAFNQYLQQNEQLRDKLKALILDQLILIIQL